MVDVPESMEGVNERNWRDETVPDNVVLSSGMWHELVWKGFRRTLAHPAPPRAFGDRFVFLDIKFHVTGYLVNKGTVHRPKTLVRGSAVQSLGILVSHGNRVWAITSGDPVPIQTKMPNPTTFAATDADRLATDGYEEQAQNNMQWGPIGMGSWTT